MIGGNALCEGFNVSWGLLSFVAGLISLQAELFSQMRILQTGVLSSGIKILVCENYG